MLSVPLSEDARGTARRRGDRCRKDGGRWRWTENARGAAGEERSAVADDRRRGAEAGKRPALEARSLFLAVTVVPRVCALPHRPPLYYAGGSGDIEGRRYTLSRAFRVQNTSFSFMILRANFAADA